MRAAIITTVRHNVGDDFVREGIIHLLRTAIGQVEVELIHKHVPATAVYGLAGLRAPRVGKALDYAAQAVRAPNRVGRADLLVQSGAPVYWCHEGGPHCSDNEWFVPLVGRRFLPDRRGRKFISIAGGSCQRFHSDGTEILTCARCRQYVREYFDACDLTLLRDRLARRMLAHAGRDAEVLPCTSIFARDRFGLRPLPGEHIILNFMEGGGHFSFGQEIDAAAWRAHFHAIAHAAMKHGPVVLACHNPAEEALAREVAPEIDRYIVPGDHLEYMKFYAAAKFGIVNRVHAAFMMASFGKPAVVIGSDSRALMIENLNLPAIFVGGVGGYAPDQLIEMALSRVESYPDEAEAIRSSARSLYIAAIAAAVDGA